MTMPLLFPMTAHMRLSMFHLAVSAALFSCAGLSAAQTSVPVAAAASAPTTLETAGAQRAVFSDRKEQIAYATGVQAARNLTRNNIPFDPEVLMQGVMDVLEGRPIRMKDKDMRIVLQGIQGEIHRNMVSNRTELLMKNRAKGEAYIAEYKKKPGVVSLPGNLHYRVIREGNGELPREESVVTVRYRGTTLDGAEFDATETENGRTVQLGQMILGWSQALKQMPVGSHWEVVIPPNLAYGDRGMGTTIGPAETLIFNIELLKTRHPER